MTAFPLPEKALVSHTAVLGKTGSGKTSTSKLFIEHAVDAGHRVCVLDPIKSDWWGVTSSASGKRPGLPFTILGGPRGHVPLLPGSGAVLGELIAEGKLPLSVLDMARFRAGEHQRFFCDLADALMRKMRGVLYLVLEEAHEFAPKERSGIGNENMAVYFAKKLATAGRSKGIRLVVATQRVQALHNAVLGSCETMVVHRMTAPADQEPVNKWLKASVGDRAMIDRIAKDLAGLPTGTAWVVSGEAVFLERVAFPLFRTFDNSAAPKKGDGLVDVTMAKVDHEALRTLVGDAVKAAEDNDPAKLKARVAALELELRSKPSAAPVIPPGVLEDEFRRGETHGFASGRAAGRLAMIEAVRKLLGPVDIELQRLAQRADDELGAAARKEPGPNLALDLPGVTDEHSIKVQAGGAAASFRLVPGGGVSSITIQAPKGAAAGTTSLPPYQLRILEALNFWHSLGFLEPTKAQLAGATGASMKSSHFTNSLGALRSAGLITYPKPGLVALTDDGWKAAPAIDDKLSARDRLKPLLSPYQERILDTLPLDGSQIGKGALAEAIGASLSSSHFTNSLGQLRTLAIIRYPIPGQVALEPWVAS